MAAKICEIADGVVSMLNAASFELGFKAQRFYAPTFELKDLVDLKVSVVPSSQAAELIARGGQATRDHVIDIGVQQTVGRGTLTALEMVEACDPLLDLVDQIGDLFLGKALATLPTIRCVAIANPTIYLPSHLEERRVFTSVLKLTFRHAR